VTKVAFGPYTTSIYRIDDMQCIPISAQADSAKHHSSGDHADEAVYLRLLHRIASLRSFYFAVGYDLTLSLQRHDAVSAGVVKAPSSSSDSVAGVAGSSSGAAAGGSTGGGGGAGALHRSGSSSSGSDGRLLLHARDSAAIAALAAGPPLDAVVTQALPNWRLSDDRCVQERQESRGRPPSPSHP
jgi:hypothetical protein